jgi:23S rRNA pseudouridine2605 synthase
MILDEGRNREVRRLLARVGHKVQRLKRVAVGPVRLGEMPSGAVRLLTKKEIQSLERAVALGRVAQTGGGTTGSKPSRRRDTGQNRQIGHQEHKGNRTVIG